MKQEIFNAYVGVVIRRFYLTEDELFTKKKSRRLSNARYLLYYLCKDRNMKVVDIKQFMEDNGYSIPHTTIIHGVKVMKKRVEEDRDYKDIVSNIKERITIN